MNLEFRNNDIALLRAALNPSYLERAEREALQNTQKKTTTLFSRAVRERYNVKASAIKERVTLSWSGDDRTEARIDWLGRRIGLMNFDARPVRVNSPRGKRKGATVLMLKSKGRSLNTIDGAGGFIAHGANSNQHVFARSDAQARVRSPSTGNMVLSREIIARSGPAIPQMVSGQQVIAAAEFFVKAEYPAQLEDKLRRFYDIQLGLR